MFSRIIFFILLLTVTLNSQTYRGLTIPTDRPRLGFRDPAVLSAAQAWFAANPFTPGSTHYADRAFVSLMTGGNETHCRAAINFVLSMQYTSWTGAAAKDNNRWHGDEVSLVYDWCYSYFTPAERTTLIDRWNGYFPNYRTLSNVSLQQPNYNYWWGFFRTEWFFGASTYHENVTLAQRELDYSLYTRWEDPSNPRNAKSYWSTNAKGGVPFEGWQYGGSNVWQFGTQIALAAKELGRDLTAETLLYVEGMYHTIYNTTTAQVISSYNATPRWEQFSNSDTHNWIYGNTAAGAEGGLGGPFYAFKRLFAGTKHAQYAQTWINQVQPLTPNVNWMKALGQVSGSPTPLPYSALPLDYYAPGPGRLLTRSSWDVGACMAYIMGGDHRTGSGHHHSDYGSFQMQCGPTWVTREDAMYYDQITGLAGVGTANGYEDLGHNVLLVNNDGMAGVDRATNGPVIVNRVQSATDFSFLANNLLGIYRTNIPYPSYPDRDNPAVVAIGRDYIYIRALNVLIVFDRIQSALAGQNKIFLFHTENNPTLDGDGKSLHHVQGSQTTFLQTVLPASFTRRVVNERTVNPTRGQYRLEVETSGATVQHFMHVVQGRATSGTDVAIALSKVGSTNILQLTHSAGFARVEIEDGVTSTGGGFAFSTVSMPTSVTPFRTGIQATTMTADGPAWITDAGPLDIATVAVPGGTVGAAYAQGMVATGGTPAYTWTVASGSLPPGLTLSTAGMISGTPTTAGSYSFTVQAQDSIGGTDTQALSITVSAAAGGTVHYIGPTRPLVQYTSIPGGPAGGDTLLFDGGGSYNAFTVGVSGSAADWVNVHCAPISGVFCDVGTGAARAVQVNADYVEVRGFQMESTTDIAIRMFGNNIRIIGNRIRNCAGPSHGILSTDAGSGNQIVEHNEIYNCGGRPAVGNDKHPVYLASDENAYPGSICLVQFNYIHGNGGEAIKTRCVRSEIKGNSIFQIAIGGVTTFYCVSLYGPEEANNNLAVRDDGEIVGNLCVTNAFSSAIRLGADLEGRESRGRYRLAFNTVISFHASLTDFVRPHLTIESIEFDSNILHSVLGGTPALVNLSTVTWTNGVQISGRNNWIRTGTTGTGTLTGTIFGTDPGLTLLASVDNVDAYPLRTSPVVNSGSESTDSVSAYPIPSPSPALYLPLRRTGAQDDPLPVERPDEFGVPDRGAFEFEGSVTRTRAVNRGNFTSTRIQ